MSKQAIKALTEELIEKHQLTVPIDVDRLAKELNIPVEYHDFEEDISGFTFHKQSEKLIGINTNDGRKRQRFTMAHEIGHMLLHKSNSVRVDSAVILFRDSHSSDGTDKAEREANRFAAELLMPVAAISHELKKLGGTVDILGYDDDKLDTTISSLAKKFNVSYQAMSVRLASLYFS